VKLSGAHIDRFIKTPDPDVHVVLLYGPDQGLVRERAQSLQSAYLGGDPGPFSQSLLFDADIRRDTMALADAVCARALDGSNSVVRLKTQGEQAAKAIAALMDALANGSIKPAALLLIEAGDLSKRSKLRQGVEQAAARAMALPCYLPDRAALRALALASTGAAGANFTDDALEVLLDRLPQNSAMASMELEKLMLYAGEGASISTGDVGACISGAGESGSGDLAFAVAGRAPQRADQLMRESLEAGQNPVGLLRAVQRHFFRLGEARAACVSGKTVKAAMASLRPPVFYAQTRAFSDQLRLWSAPALDRALGYCLQTERAMKTGGAAAENLLARLIIRLSMARSGQTLPARSETL